MAEEATVAAAPPAPTPMPRQSASQRFLLPALVAARRRFSRISRDAEAMVPDERRPYRYATLHAHLEAVTDALLGQDILVEQDVVTMRSGTNFLVTRLTHAISEEWRCGYLPLPLMPRNNPREVGATLTYFRRYGLATLLGLAATDDPDEPGAVTRFVDETEQRWPDMGDDPGPQPPDGVDQEDIASNAEPEPPAQVEPPPPPPPPPAAPPAKPTINGVAKALMAAVKESDAPHEVWLGHATFISNLTSAVRDTLVDRYRTATGSEPPMIAGVEYPPPVTPAAAPADA